MPIKLLITGPLLNKQKTTYKKSVHLLCFQMPDGKEGRLCAISLLQIMIATNIALALQLIAHCINTPSFVIY